MAIYNQQIGRIEIYLVSQTKQKFTIDNREFHLEENERVLTEFSHKYTLAGFQAMAEKAGFSHRITWTDEAHQFATMHLVYDAK